MFHLPDLAATVSGNVSLSELAEAFVHTTDSSGDVRDFIINKIVPAYGLRQFEKALEKATGINLSHVLNHKDILYWPQICTAFEVRHLVEHRDGRVDRKFRKDLAPFWGQSSWGRRDSLERLKKVPVEEEDVFETYTTMFEATGLITAEVLHWNSGVPR